MIDLFKEALERCDEDEADFDWNKNLKIENSYISKNTNNKSMINQKSDTSHLLRANETGITPGVLKSSGLYLNNEDNSGINIEKIEENDKEEEFNQNHKSNKKR